MMGSPNMVRDNIWFSASSSVTAKTYQQFRRNSRKSDISHSIADTSRAEDFALLDPSGRRLIFRLVLCSENVITLWNRILAMDVDLRQLRALLAVAEHGSFNRAAVAIDISQPAVSKSIAALEHALRTELFQRGPRGAVITKAGEILARAAAGTVNIMQDAEREITSLAHGDGGQLTIGATPSTMAGVVPLACARLAATGRVPSISIREGLDADLVPALELGEIDILVGPVADLHGCPAHLTECTLIEEGLSIGVRPGHRLSMCREIDLHRLSDASWILPGSGSRFHHLVETMFSAAAMPWPTTCITTSDLAAQEIIALASDYVLLLSGIQLMGRQSPLICIPIRNAPRRRIGWRRLTALRPSRAAEDFIENLSLVVKDAASQTAMLSPNA
jgi:DNA-binding transcriptional LysR family regulator